MDLLFIALVPLALVLFVGLILATKRKLDYHKHESDMNFQELLTKTKSDNNKKEKK